MRKSAILGIVIALGLPLAAAGQMDTKPEACPVMGPAQGVLEPCNTPSEFAAATNERGTTEARLAIGQAAPVWRWDLPEGFPPPVVPVDNPMGEVKVELGRRLSYDADLSVDGTMACVTCHEQKHAFADDNATHPGVTGEPGRRNVPGLANIG